MLQLSAPQIPLLLPHAPLLHETTTLLVRQVSEVEQVVPGILLCEFELDLSEKAKKK
jgi:hypothetical protein